MIKLQINDKEFNIVNSYEELTLGQYIDIINVSESKVSNSIDNDIKIISALSNNKEELNSILWDFNTEEFDELKEEFKWVEDNADVLNEFKSLEPKESLEIEGKKYGIISNYNKMSMGEIVSFESLMKSASSDFHRLEIAFGILLRPIEDGKLVKFTEDIFLEVVKNKYKINMMEIYSTIGFFLSGAKISTKGTTKRFSIQTK